MLYCLQVQCRVYTCYDVDCGHIESYPKISAVFQPKVKVNTLSITLVNMHIRLINKNIIFNY